MSFNQNSEINAELMKTIREAIQGKEKNRPLMLSQEEYDAKQHLYVNYHLQNSLASIWGEVNIQECDGIIVRKKQSRDETPYLVFESTAQFMEYRRCCRLLGQLAYYLLESRVEPKLKEIATACGVAEDVCEEVREEIERCVGLYFKMPDGDMTDEHLAASLGSYVSKTIDSKAQSIFSKNAGILLYIDAIGFDTLEAPTPEQSSMIYSTYDGNVDIIKLAASIYNYIDYLLRQGDCGKRADIKDLLMPQVVRSKNATRKFLNVYYSIITDRVSLWRPIAFAYQLVYAFENGEKYLKNPTFISACKNTSLKSMISKLIEFAGQLGKLRGFAGRIAEKGLDLQLLKECAASTEQIGKSLSKELRTREALTALSEALVVSATERTGIDIYSQEGESSHE